MKTIETLITDIKNNNEKSKKLRSSIYQQQEELMDKVRIALEEKGIELEPKQNRLYGGDTDITIGNDYESNYRVRIYFSSGNFRIELPPVFKTPNAHIQFVIYDVLAKFQDEVMDIQLDIANEYLIDRYSDKNELIDMITDKLVSSLLEGGKIKADGKSYEYVETIKGRVVVNINKVVMYGNEKQTETKSYFPSKLKDIFRSSADKMADTMIKN